MWVCGKEAEEECLIKGNVWEGKVGKGEVWDVNELEESSGKD